jgi:ketosteroid isomerase-like protein
MQTRRDLLKAAATLPLISASSGVLSANEIHDPLDFPYGPPRGRYPEPEFIRDALRLHFGSALSKKENLFNGWDDAIVAYGMAPEPIGKELLKSFYSAVFSDFPDFRLVDDALLVAGDMGAHRYHALGTHIGGANASGKRIMFRGQTIYRVNKYGKVNWRLSNHDHEYREAQLAYDVGVPARSWSPTLFANTDAYHEERAIADALDLPEMLVRRRMAAFVAAVNSVESSSMWDFYLENAQIHGLHPDDPLAISELRELRELLDSFRNSATEFHFDSDTLIVCGPFAIQRYYLSSSSASNASRGRGETIYRFDKDWRIAEQWINHDRRYAHNG